MQCVLLILSFSAYQFSQLFEHSRTIDEYENFIFHIHTQCAHGNSEFHVILNALHLKRILNGTPRTMPSIQMPSNYYSMRVHIIPTINAENDSQPNHAHSNRTENWNEAHTTETANNKTHANSVANFIVLP